MPRRLPPEPLDPNEVRALLDACADSPTGVRNRALIAVLWRSGLRVTEALSLHPKDLDATRGAVRVLRGKGGRSRTVGMDGAAFDLVAAWLAVRATWEVGPRSPLFCLADGTPVTSSYVRVLIPRLGRAAGIAKRVHAHGLRHTHAAELRTEGVDIGIISRQLVHRSIATTATYLDHIAPVAVTEAMRGRVW